MAEAAAAPVITGNQYSEAQHFSLLKSAVEQETAALTTVKSELEAQVATLGSEKAALATELSEAQSKIDVLESDKATAEAATEIAKTELADFKAFIDKKKDVEDKKSSRKDRVKAANEHLGDSYFSDERITRWAEMSDEAFDALVGEMTEFAAAAKPEASESASTKTTEMAKETAAFTGGVSANSTEGSSLSTFLGVRRRGAVA